MSNYDITFLIVASDEVFAFEDADCFLLFVGGAYHVADDFPLLACHKKQFDFNIMLGWGLCSPMKMDVHCRDSSFSMGRFALSTGINGSHEEDYRHS